ncbi:MAG TPA: polyribonucleotide nucleotidyltransferase [Armatimonadota bacterium]
MGRTLTLETGRLAKQAEAAVLATYGETVILCTVTVSRDPLPMDFLPLRADFEEKMYSVGKIPGGFFKREGRPSEEGTLICRKIDRPIRPLLPQGLRNDVQVIATALSVENENAPDLVAMIGCSAAMHLSSLPFDGPFGVITVARVDGEFIFNPSFEQRTTGDMEATVVATRKGVVMVEMGGEEVPEDIVADALDQGTAACLPIVEMIERLRDKAGVPKKEYALWAPRPEIVKYVRAEATDRVAAMIALKDKGERYAAEHEIVADLTAALADKFEKAQTDVKAAVEEIEQEQMMKLILETGHRADGRAYDQLRALSAEAGLLPRTHGSAVFTRGETQVLATVTLGATRDQRMVRTLEQEDYTRFSLHYNFPPFSVGEVRPLRGPGRREIGHGHLAQKAVERMLPPVEDFAYTCRIVCEVLESNGSSSMASACAASLALMDAGVKIKAPIAGIAMGLIHESDDKYAVLTDIQGLEDHAGHMDFKVAGSANGVCALQLDMKVPGLNPRILREALAQGREARLQILDAMLAALPEAREDFSRYAPRMFSLKIDTEKIGMVIGPGGKNIRKLQEAYETQIDISDDGTVLVFGEDSEKAEACRQAIYDMTRDVEVGEIFTGKVVSTTAFGAFVELMPGRDGLVHISQLAPHRVEKTEDFCKVGDELRVKVIEVDSEGKVRLTAKDVDNDVIPEPRERSGGGRGGDRGGRGGRGGDRGGRGGDRGGDRGGRSSSSSSSSESSSAPVAPTGGAPAPEVAAPSGGGEDEARGRVYFRKKS